MLDTTKVIKAIIKREGGYVNHSSDRGGPTNMGITLKTLEDYRKRTMTEADVKALTEAEATEIYRKKYVTPVVEYANSQELLDLLVDSAVLHGAGRVLGWISDIKQTSPDSDVLYRGVLKQRYKLISEIVFNTPTQVVFLKGWINRLGEFIR